LQIKKLNKLYDLPKIGKKPTYTKINRNKLSKMWCHSGKRQNTMAT